MPEIAFDRYYRYDDLIKLLHAYVAEYPDLVKIDTIGQSHEGREIPLVTVTAGGNDKDKPAFWCDGNIHASEVSASTAVLYLVNKLCTQYGKDAQVTRALDTRAFYLVPRVNPDGAEWALDSPPRIIRSSTRPYPYDEDDYYGIERQDIDGDGRILSMRIEDPNGPWKISEKEPRLLELREPAESGGTYYRVMPEGLFHNFDGLTMRPRKIKQGLDMNRNFPSAWRPDSEQYGAGPYPTSEPEVHALVQAVINRPNICGAISFHTFSGVHLRPPSRYPDDDMAPEDLWAFKAIGRKATELTGYPAISTFHEFKYHPKEVITGIFDDWMYENRGVYAWTTEIWSPQRQAGITDYKYIDWEREHPFEDDLKLLAWNDEKLDGKGYVEWFVFEHPQLGKVELGGWDSFYAFRNPPLQFLENEVAPFSDWVIWQALTTPKLELREVRVEDAGSGAKRIRFAVQNTGWLPTNVTKLAQTKNICRGVVAELSRVGEDRDSAGAAEPEWLYSGLLRQQGLHLVGRNHVEQGVFGWHFDATGDVAVFEWVVAPGEYNLVAQQDRAGVVRETVRC